MSFDALLYLLLLAGLIACWWRIKSHTPHGTRYETEEEMEAAAREKLNLAAMPKQGLDNAHD